MLHEYWLILGSDNIYVNVLIVNVSDAVGHAVSLAILLYF